MSRRNRRLVIFGTGEIGELAHYYFTNDSEYEVVAFTADDDFVKSNTFHGLPLVPFSDLLAKYAPDDHEAHVALSYNKLNQVRSEKYLAMKSKGYALASYVCSKSVYWGNLSIGDNCFILENQTIQPGVRIGANVMIWSGNHLGHGSIIKDHTYISSHVCISGHTEIGTHCFLGVNSATRDFVRIGNGVFVAMGATVTRDVEDGSVVIGAKGSVFSKDSKIATGLKRRYFDL